MAVSPLKHRANVLKLVCPGGSVEVHRKPITAAEVMSRKPRHFVTRPDVFEYPWIVVRPESILEPGRVFYVVPARTIYRLLKLKGYYSGHRRNANLPEDDNAFPDYASSCSGDPPFLVKRGSNHDCEKTERCNLGEHDRGNVLSDSESAHLSNVLAPNRQCHDSMESSRYRKREQNELYSASSSREVSQSHHRRRQLSLDSSEERNHCLFKGYDSDSAQLKSNTAKRWSHYKQTSGQKLIEYDSTSSAVNDKGSLKSASLISLFSKLALSRKDKLDGISKRKIMANFGNPCKEMVSDRENVGERHGLMKFHFTGGIGKSKYASSSSLFDVLVRGRLLCDSSKDTNRNEEMELQAASVGSMHPIDQLSENSSAKNQSSEEVLSGDTSFTFDIPLRAESDVPHMPHTIGYNSIFNYVNCQLEENGSVICQRKQDASTDPISDSFLRIRPKNLLKTEVGHDRPESSCAESGDDDKGREHVVTMEPEVRSCLRKTKNRLPATPSVKFTLPGEDYNNLRVEVFEFTKED